jgi:hypothetical protein
VGQNGPSVHVRSLLCSTTKWVRSLFPDGRAKRRDSAFVPAFGDSVQKTT